MSREAPPAETLAFESIASLRARLSSKEISAEELIAVFADRAAQLNQVSKAFIEITGEAARQEAVRCDRDMESGRPRGPLHGIPYAVKDLIDVAGVKTTAGSRVLADNIAGSDAQVVTRLRESGAICLGKANLHEFAYGATGENPVYGTAVNAYDRTRLACGSSSGSAAALAFGLCPAALGTDTGGSVRAPAVLNGLVGLKPTFGRVSTRGVIPYAWTLDHVGTITRTAADAARLLQVLAGHDPDDPANANEPVPDYASGLGRGVAGLRIGMPRRFYYERSDPEILARAEAVLQSLERRGASLVEVALPEMDHVRTVSLTIQMPESLSYHSRYLEERGELYGPDFRAGLALGQCLLAEHYVRAKRFLERFRRETSAVLDEVDVLVTPATPIIAPKIGTVDITQDGVREAAGNAITRFTTFFNMTGHPAMTLPCGLHSEGLPMGVQVIGRYFDEVTLFRIAAAIESEDAFKIPLPVVTC